MRKIVSGVFCVVLCFAVAFIFPHVGKSNEYVDSSSQCLTCHTVVNPLEEEGYEGEQHYDHEGKKNPNTGEDITCTDCHEGAPGAGNVKAHACTVCHLSKCESINTHESQHGATCITSECHTECESPCPSEEIYGENSVEVELLRYFRDNVLSATPEGREIIRLYYQLSPVIVMAMRNDGEFREEVKEMIDGILLLIMEEAE